MRLRTYKYRIYPSEEQKLLLAKHFGSCRFVYNWGLDKKIKEYQATGHNCSLLKLKKDLTKIKNTEEFCWLKEVNSQSIQESLAHLETAFIKFFRKLTRFPKFKSKKSSKQSFSIPQNTRVDFETGHISIPKFKSGIKTKLHRTFNGIVKSSTISKTTTDKYFISILVECENIEVSNRPICENKAVGIDLGIKTFATLSNGIKINNPKYLKQSLNKIRRLQRSLSRKKKGSSNRSKARNLLAIAHEKATNQRNDFLNKVTTLLVDSYDTLCLETLNVKGMLKCHHLAQSIFDVSIGAFNKMIEYKAKERGVNLLRIGQFEPSSKMCTCGHINNDLSLSMRSWTCPRCGLEHDRDLLAANNIKRFAFNSLRTAGDVGSYA